MSSGAHATTTGTVDFVVGEKTYQTWYMITSSDLKSMTTSGATPLVTLHGGPGMSHHYMLPNKALYERANIPVVFYDQLGNGQSTHVKDQPESFWNPELFMDELDNLLSRLGIADNFDLIGHSWGGMLAGQYAATRSPKGLKRLIIANAPASVELYNRGISALFEHLPEGTLEMVWKREEEGTTDAKEYKDVSTQFNTKHCCTMDPWPEQLMESFNNARQNPVVNSTLFGPSAFWIKGVMKDWSVVSVLHKVKVPTLVLSAPTDQVQEISVRPWFMEIPKVKWIELRNSSHLAQFEEPERYFEVVRDFLKGTVV